MPSVKIRPNEHIRPRFSVPESHTIRFSLTSDVPLETYIVRPAGLDLFEQGSDSFKYYGGFPSPRRLQNQTLVLPFEGKWHLLMVNRSTKKVANVDYSVFYE
jgi:hypothetical protein